MSIIRSREIQPETGRNQAIIETWQTLAEVRRLEFVARPGAQSMTGWNGYGEGEVVIAASGNALRFTEHGRFRAQGSAGAMTFHNVYRWRLDAGAIELSHERFGADAPVRLFDLVAAGPARLVTRTAHQCAADRYSAELRLAEAGIMLDWRIRGPRKDEHLHYVYRR